MRPIGGSSSSLDSLALGTSPSTRYHHIRPGAEIGKGIRSAFGSNGDLSHLNSGTTSSEHLLISEGIHPMNPLMKNRVNSQSTQSIKSYAIPSMEKDIVDDPIPEDSNSGYKEAAGNGDIDPAPQMEYSEPRPIISPRSHAIMESDGEKSDHGDDDKSAMPPSPSANERKRKKKKKSQEAKRIIRNSFYETEYCIPNDSNNKDCGTDNLKKLAELDLSRPEVERLLEEFSNQILLEDLASWQRMVAFRGMITNAVFFYTVFTNPTFHNAIAHVDSWHLAFDVETLKFCMLSMAFMKKLIDLSSRFLNSQLKPTLKFMGQFVLRKPGLTIADEGESFIMPKTIQNLKYVIDTAEGAEAVVESVDGPYDTNDLEISLNLIGSMKGVLTVAETINRKAPRKFNHFMAPFLAGASIVLNCDKIITNPQDFMQDQIIEFQIMVDVMKLVESYRINQRRIRMSNRHHPFRKDV